MTAKNYLFRIEDTGEMFFVQALNSKEAFEIAQGVIEDYTDDSPEECLIGIYSDEEADFLGYDTY